MDSVEESPIGRYRVTLVVDVSVVDELRFRSRGFASLEAAVPEGLTTRPTSLTLGEQLSRAIYDQQAALGVTVNGIGVRPQSMRADGSADALQIDALEPDWMNWEPPQAP